MELVDIASHFMSQFSICQVGIIMLVIDSVMVIHWITM